jgi:hypothetical protein
VTWYKGDTGTAVCVFGSRSGVPRDVVRRIVDDLGDVTIVLGGAAGVDQDALERALELRRSVIVVPAQWTVYDRTAGPIRNETMARVADRGVGLRRPGVSRGTDNMATQLRRLRKPVELRLATVSDSRCRVCEKKGRRRG